MNINILNTLIQGISEQIPLINSYYNLSPYESWNTKEVKYGSLSFVITRVNTRQSTTTYDATIYYADRLIEDNSNRDAVYSDAATVIQTIVGALNTADDYLQVSYPVGITLFEQDFADKLAGGYATLSISTEGMGECFEDDFKVPEIIATSAYWTKDEISELFPLKTELSTVAYTGAFDDLKGTPNFVTQEQYDNLYTGVLDATGMLAGQIEQKVSLSYFDGWSKNVEVELSDKVTQQQYDNLTQAVIDSTTALAEEVKNRVDSEFFSAWGESLENDLANKVNLQDYNQLAQQIETDIDSIEGRLDDKVGKPEFYDYTDETDAELANRATIQQYNDLYDAVIESTSELAIDISQRTSIYDFADFKNTVNNELANRATIQQYNDLYDGVLTATGNLAKEIESKVSDAEYNAFADRVEAELANRATIQQYNDLVNDVEDVNDSLADKVNVQNFNQLSERVNTGINSITTDLETKVDFEYFYNWVEQADLDDKVSQAQLDEVINTVEYNKTVTDAALDAKLDDAYFAAWRDNIEAEVANKVTRQAFDNFAENVYDKSEIDDKLQSYEIVIRQYLESPEMEADVLEIVKPIVEEYVESPEMKEDILEIVTPIVEEYLDTELDNYYTKTEIDNKIGDINSILDNVLYAI